MQVHNITHDRRLCKFTLTPHTPTTLSRSVNSGGYWWQKTFKTGFAAHKLAKDMTTSNTIEQTRHDYRKLIDKGVHNGVTAFICKFTYEYQRSCIYGINFLPPETELGSIFTIYGGIAEVIELL